jgi:hypothetical protein
MVEAQLAGMAHPRPVIADFAEFRIGGRLWIAFNTAESGRGTFLRCRPRVAPALRLAEERRESRRTADPRPRHHRRRARHGSGWQLGLGVSVLRQAGTGVLESPESVQRMRDLFEAMDSVPRGHPDVREYSRKISKPAPRVNRRAMRCLRLRRG